MTDKFQPLLESTKFQLLNESERASMKILLENADVEQQRLITEGTLSGDVAQFTPILLPLVRRVYPQLIANEILGVQPMTSPTGYIYALTNQYLGTDNNKAAVNSKGAILQLDTVTGLNVGDVISTEASPTPATDPTATVLYIEDDKVLVAQGIVPIETGATLDSAQVVEGVFSNEAAFGRILKGYTGSYTTAQGEALGKDMREVGFSISRKNVEVKTRALKGQYSVEMYQDLKAQHGLLADEEIMSLMSYEVQSEMDREVVDFVNANATQLADSITFSANPRDAMAGRWEIEKYRREAIRIDREAAQIGIDTKRGQGNILLVSPGVATMLEQVGTFKTAEVAGPNGVKSPVSGGVAGVYNNKYKVVVDQYAVSDYATVMYKGADRRDAMGFLAPYVPLSFAKVTHADSGQPAIIAKTRYALDTIPGSVDPKSNDRAKTYARSFAIDLSNTALSKSVEA